MRLTRSMRQAVSTSQSKLTAMIPVKGTRVVAAGAFPEVTASSRIESRGEAQTTAHKVIVFSV